MLMENRQQILIVADAAEQVAPEKLDVIAQSDLGEHTNSSPVPADKALIIRTHEGLWCVGGEG